MRKLVFIKPLPCTFAQAFVQTCAVRHLYRPLLPKMRYYKVTMQTEIEAKWLNINPDTLRAALQRIGATCVTPERLMRRATFDHPGLTQKNSWVRVRDEGDKVTLSYKQLDDRTVHGTKEICLVVDNFATARSFVEVIGLTQKNYQETRRESWKLGDTEIDIDFWPWIPPLVEIEAPSEDEVYAVAEKLKLAKGQALHGSVETAYQAVYNVTDDEVNQCPEIKFVEIPDWLRERARQIP